MDNKKETIFDNWNINSDNQPLIISGPCSAESEKSNFIYRKRAKKSGGRCF